MLYRMTDAPMLTIMTRTFGERPKLFAAHIAALEGQTLQDYQHLVIQCPKAGVHYANRILNRHRHEIKGHYVMILDDDDRLEDDRVLEELEAVIMRERADFIVAKMQRPERLVPDKKHWGRLPFVRGQIGSPCLIMHRTLAIQNLHFFGRPTAGDYHMARELEWRAKKIYWWDRTVARIPVVSHGASEAADD